MWQLSSEQNDDTMDGTGVEERGAAGMVRVSEVAHTGDVTGLEVPVKFLNFRTPENFAVINLKFKQGGQTLGYFVKKTQME